VISERTVKLYEQHPPEARQGQQAPTLPELLHEVEVAAKFGTLAGRVGSSAGAAPRAVRVTGRGRRRQLGLNRGLSSFDPW
jgi:hypothetical protein